MNKQQNEQLLLRGQVQAFQTKFAGLQTESEGLLSSRSRLLIELEEANARAQQLEADLRDAETLRRKLHNQVQELKGNIRVFCRVRPPLGELFAVLMAMSLNDGYSCRKRYRRRPSHN